MVIIVLNGIFVFIDSNEVVISLTQNSLLSNTGIYNLYENNFQTPLGVIS